VFLCATGSARASRFPDFVGHALRPCIPVPRFLWGTRSAHASRFPDFVGHALRACILVP